MRKMLGMLLVGGALLHLGCSVTVGTVNLGTGEGNLDNKTTIDQPVEVDADTAATIPLIP